MKTQYSLIAAGILAAGLTLNSGSAHALEPSGLASAKRLVDDDRQQCPTAGYTTVGAALADAPPGSTVTVCAGTYTEQLLIDAKPGLKLVGKDMPRIVAPDNIDGAVIMVRNSSNVVVQGLAVDGNFAFSPASSSMTGIEFNNASGTISNNIISHIRHSTLDTSPQGDGIRVFGSTAVKPLAVKILSNTITDFQYAGISVSGNYKPTISRNLIQTTTGPNDPSGILLDGLPGGTISGNVIANTYGFAHAILNTGIKLVNSSHVKITSNTITGSRAGVYVRGVLLTAEANSISGNRILDCKTGVLIDTSTSGRANNNSIKGNKIIANDYSLTNVGVRVNGDTLAAGNKITGNTIEGYFFGSVVDRGANTVVSGNKWKQFATPGA